MATELVIRSWCDPCLDAGEHTPGETLTVAVGVVPAFDIEVCPRHAKPLAEAVADLAAHGRKVGTGVPKTPGEASEHKGRADDAPGRYACPVCADAGAVRVAPSLSAVRQHLRDEHGKSLADVGLAEARHTCPECGSKYPNGQGLAAHIRVTHPAAYARRKQAS